MCVSLTVSMLLDGRDVDPNPGMLLPCDGRLDRADPLTAVERLEAIVLAGRCA